MQLSAKWIKGEDNLLAFLDLLGTREFYQNHDLNQQIERISQLINALLEGLEDRFKEPERKQFLYVHMYGDSIVIAEKKKGAIADCADKLIQLMLGVQYKVLIDSQRTLSRALVRRGPYYGMICGDDQTSLESLYWNFSLVGGAALVEMDKTQLRGLPVGTYIDSLITGETQILENRLIVVDDDSLRFVKPEAKFDFLRSVLNGPKSIDDWVNQLIEESGNNEVVRKKLIPWRDAVQGRCNSIQRQHGSDES
jgi:hypothetical protein